ncbi:(+)-delta-cadinene synthase [Heracleum sosnowskyi]|uniref:(+)-delta-cadinene synthase n=1 Tax=Heracleum sosnowskyi TaxID=360622 RepID=A0AAD8MW02_9APIA|nr:(+)-delta-cadinene synthase [Heracleum sosnowskyi]
MALAPCSHVLISCNFGRYVNSPQVTAMKPVIKSLSGDSQRSKVSLSKQPVVRRSGDYQPGKWDYEFFQSLKSDYTGKRCNARASQLKEDVKLIFKNLTEALDQLELIDHLKRLGLGHHFDEEIKLTLTKIHNTDQTSDDDEWEKNLHATALKFRLLREHGYHISSEVFKCFTENERFKACLGKDVKGMLSLYEASYYSIQGESLMEEAYSYTSSILKEWVKSIDDSDLGMQVTHALELPLQWRIPRFDAIRYMDIYERSSAMMPAVLEFAKFDFNILQGLNQEELKDVSRWWKKTGLGHKLNFIRDRLATSFLWTVGISCKPEHRYFRIQIAKVIQLITTLDDVYDVYATLDELELFTSVIERWDIDAMTELPHYMKICFMTLYNLVNEIAYDILMEQNIDVLPQLKKSWTDLLKVYLVEARWYHSGHQPTFDEFLSNGLVSITGPIIAIQSYIFTSNPIKKEEMDYIEELPKFLELASEIFRLSDDYGTSSNELKRGDVPKSIQCYMMDTGVSEEVAREHMINLMKKKWAAVMKCRFADNIPLDWSFVEIVLNLVRTAHCMYNAGDDGHGVEDGLTKDRISSLFYEPIPQETLIGKD